MTRIAMIIGRYRPKIGGTEIQAERLAQALMQRGVSVEVLTGRERDLPAEETLGGVRVKRLWIPDVGIPSLNALAFGVGLYLTLLKQHAHFDVLHIHQGLYPAYVAVLAAKHINKPAIVKLSSSGVRLDLHQLANQVGFLGRHAANFLAQNTSSFVALNTEIADALTQDWQVPPTRIACIPNGVELPQVFASANSRHTYRENLSLPLDIPLMLCVGSLRSVKNHLLAIQALSLLVKSGSKARLLLLGDGPLRLDLERQVHDYGLDESVMFMGRVANVKDYLYAADVFLLPSLVEGLSNALLEAMAVGLPCIASDIPGNKQAIEHNADGLLFESDNAKALANMIARVLSTSELAMRLGTQARRKIAQAYSIEAVVEQYLALYNTLRSE
jgi:glycosyltransferase involved in cell wall biosynthesis